MPNAYINFGIDLLPATSNSYNLGSSSQKWNIYGTLTGNASTATGANITSTTNAISIYSNTTGTFSSVASKNGALYATTANGTVTFGTLPVAQGGTNATSVTKFGIAYGNSSANGYTFTAAGSDGYILIGKGASTAPTWQQTLPVNHGGTGLTSWTQWGLVYASNSTTLAQVTAGAAGNANQPLISKGAAAPSWYSGLTLEGASTTAVATFSNEVKAVKYTYITSAGVSKAYTTYNTTDDSIDFVFS